MSGSSWKFELGQEVKDIVSGFSGVIMCRSEYFTGCRHYGLASRELTNEGKVKDWEYFDESRLVLVSNKNALKPSEKKTGGPCSNPPQMG